MRALRPSLAALALAASLLTAACGDDGGGGGGGASVGAVATTTQVADLVRSVGGERVDVDGILPPNADPHDYEPRPSDAAALADAEVVFRSGGDLDEWLDEVVDSAGGDARQVTLIDSVERAGDDPHWWQDPRNAIARRRRDPRRAGRGRSRRAAPATSGARRRTRAGCAGSTAEVARCIARVPAAKRKLVTTHDALGYFADRYGLEVIGAVIPSLSTQAQPSAKDVGELVDQIETEGVEAIFPEAALNQKLEQAISREAGADVGGELWADTLGPEGSTGATYVGAIRSNAATIAAGLSGGRVSCGFSR